MLHYIKNRILPPIAFGLALLCTPHCAMTSVEDDSVNAAIGDESGVILSAATWTLDWNTEGIDFDENGGFSVTTNLGYRVHVNSGHLVLHRVALIPCASQPSETASFVDISVRSVFAHEDESDPSSMETLAIFDITHPTAREIGANSFSPLRYCQAYWLIARGMDGATTAEGLDMSNRSLIIDGSWERGSESGPLSIDTWWPGGTIMNMQSLVEPNDFSTAASETSVHFAFTTINIAMGQMFDDIEFNSDSDGMITDTILDNLTVGTTSAVDLKSL